MVHPGKAKNIQPGSNPDKATTSEELFSLGPVPAFLDRPGIDPPKQYSFDIYGRNHSYTMEICHQ